MCHKKGIKLIPTASTANVLSSYNRLSHKLVIEVLHLVKQYLLVCKTKDDLPPAVVQTDEDSQDYGDWSGFGDLVVQDANKPAAEVQSLGIQSLIDLANHSSIFWLPFMIPFIECFRIALVQINSQKKVYLSRWLIRGLLSLGF